MSIIPLCYLTTLTKIRFLFIFKKLQSALQTKLAQLEILNQRENQLLLNAALRTKSAQEDAADNWENNLNNNNLLCTGSGRVINPKTQQLKKYKCKSLDVSLDDLNANNLPKSEILVLGNIPKTSQIAEPWPGTNIPNLNNSSTVELLAVKEYSTTLPRVKGQPETGEAVTVSLDSEEEDEEEEEELYDEEDEERRTLHTRGKRNKTESKLNSTVPSGGVAPRIGSAGTVIITSSEILTLNSNSNSNSRSKSLPQSVTNSMDCLTNEAYEDDEDLINEGGSGSNNGLRKVLTASSAMNARIPTHDKDFITKL